MKTAHSDGSVRSTVLTGVILGALALAVLQTCSEVFASSPFIGAFIYNYYFLALTDGTLTIPVQIAGLEGFYDSEGRAFLYHGLGPLITRVVVWPFLDLTVWDLRAPTIWLFASTGSTAFYILANGMLDGFWPEDGVQRRRLAMVLWVMIWGLAPGVVFAANGSFFHEPVAFAFAMMGIALLCLWRLTRSEFSGGFWFLGMCLAGACAVHGRPHVAVGIYSVAVIAALFMLWKFRMRVLSHRQARKRVKASPKTAPIIM